MAVVDHGSLGDGLVDVSHLPAVSLGELIATADLQTRRDRKYLLPAATAKAVLDGLRGRALDIDGLRRFRYESIYFDTPGWASYLSAARRRPRRFKVRTRAYLDSGECMLEVKVRDHRGNTVKHRHDYEVAARDQLTVDGAAFVESVDASAPFTADLEPVLTVSYQRSTLLLDEDGSRLTVDQYAAWDRAGMAANLGDLVLLESKTAGRPSSVDRVLWRWGHRPIVISKYCTGIAALEPDLPSNKWHRVLQRHLAPSDLGR